MRHGQPPRSTKKIAFISLAHRPGPMTASLRRWRQQRREDPPFCIGQITGVAQIVPVMLCPGLGGPHRRLQEWGSAQIPWNCRISSPRQAVSRRPLTAISSHFVAASATGVGLPPPATQDAGREELAPPAHSAYGRSMLEPGSNRFKNPRQPLTWPMPITIFPTLCHVLAEQG